MLQQLGVRGKEGSRGWERTAAVTPQQGRRGKWMLVRVEPHVCSKCARIDAVQNRHSVSPLTCWQVLSSWGSSSLDAGDEVAPSLCVFPPSLP